MKTEPRRVRVRALGKINLGLKVLYKRPDGFHELRTVYQTISLADTLDVEFTPSRRTSAELISDPAIPDNLVLRAARVVMDAARVTGRVSFQLKKRIPMGAGLGGGSSDAAAVLLALPVLAGRPLGPDALVELAGELGSDVPFFLLGGTAVGVGRGTELYPLPDLPPAKGLVVAPRVHVSTADAYRALDLELTTAAPGNIISSFQSVVWGSGLECAAGGLPAAENDFEEAVFGKYPRLKSLKRKLQKLGAEPAMMTGSGSALFGLFRTPEALHRARFSLQEEIVFPIRLVSRVRYRALWRRWLAPHVDPKVWPPKSRNPW